MFLRGLFLLLLVAAAASPSIAAPSDAADRTKLIVGTWEGPRRIRVFHANGAWGVKKFEEDSEEINGRRWRIEGNKLILIYPGDNGFESHAYTFLSFSRDRFVTQTDGYREEYTRIQKRPPTPNQSLEPTVGRRDDQI